MVKQLRAGTSFAYYITHKKKSHYDATLSCEGTSSQARHSAKVSVSAIRIIVHVLNVTNADC